MDIDVRAARVALAAAIDTIPGLRVHSRFPDSINPPAAVVYRRETRYAPAFDVGADVTLAVRVYVGIGNPGGAQDKLDDYFAPTGALSIPAAIHADPTLNGTVDFLSISPAEAEGLVEFQGTSYISVDLPVEVG